MVFRDLHTRNSQNTPQNKGGEVFVRYYDKAMAYIRPYIQRLLQWYQQLPQAWRYQGLMIIGVVLVLGIFSASSYAVLSGGVELGSTGTEGGTGQLAAAAAAGAEVENVIPGTSGAGGGFGSFGATEEAPLASGTVAQEELTASGEAIGGGSFGIFSGLGAALGGGSTSGSGFGFFSSGSTAASNTATASAASGGPTNTETPSDTSTPSNTDTTPPPVTDQNVFTPTTPPAVSVIATLSNTPATLTRDATTSVLVGGTNVTQYKYRLDTGAFTGPYSVSQRINLNVSDGTHTLHVVGGDAQGNFQTEGDATSVVWAVDTTPPVAQINGISGNVISSDTTTLSIGGTGVTHYTFSLDGGGYSSERSVNENIVLSGLNEGEHTIRVRGRDTVGNYQSDANAAFLTWTVDVNAPQVNDFAISTNTDRATFEWDTTEATQATLELGLRGADYSYTDTHGNTDTTLVHSMTVAGLQHCSTFIYRVTSEDKGGFTAVQEGTITTNGCTGFAEVLAQTDSFISYNIGGALHLLDNSGRGIELTVPAFFAGTGRDAQFQIKKLEKNAYVNALDGPPDVSRIGDYIYRLSALEDVSTLISAFDQDLTVRIYYDPAELNGVKEDSLSIRRHDGEKWNHLQNCSVNTTAHFVTCTTDHFSDFELFGETPAALTGTSDTLSDSDLGVTSSHTIRYTSSSSVTAGEDISTAFDDTGDGFDGWESLTISDITFTGATLVSSCGAGTDEVTLTVRTDTENEGIRFTVCPGDTVSAGQKVITIASGKISNPSSAGSYVIKIRSGSDDNSDEFAKTRVAILPDVVVTARVQPSLTFVVLGTSAGVANANDIGTTSITTTATTIPWGELTVGSAKTARHDLQIATNSTNGFSVTVHQDQNLTSASGADIDAFKDGSNPASPEAWAAPSNTIGDENTFGHFGITTSDSTLAGGDTFGNALYDAIGTLLAPLEVFYHSGPADGATVDKGAVQVGYKIEIGSLQESGTDYTSTLKYIATPTF